MPFNLLLFPLAGGYFLLVTWLPLKYFHQRVERQKLIFHSVIAGIFLLITAFTIRYFVNLHFSEIKEAIAPKSPVDQPFFRTTLGAFILGIIIPYATNWWFSRQKWITKAIKDIGNELELLLVTSHTNGELISFTLGNNKTYVGWVKSLPIPNRSDYINIFPTLSGYRDKSTLEITFTTQYLDVYASYVRDGYIEDISDLTSLVIKVDEIVSANKFSDEMYNRFTTNPQAIDSEQEQGDSDDIIQDS